MERTMRVAHALVSLVLVVALAACSTSESGSPTSPVARASAASSWSLPAQPSSNEPPLPPLQDPADPVVIAYCSMQDKVVTLEGKLLTDPPPLETSIRYMRKAQRAAGLSVGVFRNAGKPELARLAQRWTDSFDEVVAGLQRGEREIDALTPAIRGLGALERRFSCELDG